MRCSRSCSGALVLLQEQPQPALRGLQPRGEDLGEAGPAPHLGDELFETLLLRVVERAIVTHRLDVVPARIGVTGKSSTVHPGTDGLDSDDLRRRRSQQLPVVAHEENRLGSGRELRFEPAFSGDVEEVVGLIEQEHVVGPPQQGLQRQPLLLAAAESAQRPSCHGIERLAQRPLAARIPEDLGVVTPGVTPVAEGMGVAHRVVGASPARRSERRSSAADPWWGETDEQVADRGRRVRRRVGHPDELSHDAQRSVDGRRARRRSLVAGEEAQEGGFADAIGTDEGDLLAVADAKN